MDDEFRIRCDVEREPLCGERFRKENKNRERKRFTGGLAGCESYHFSIERL